MMLMALAGAFPLPCRLGRLDWARWEREGVRVKKALADLSPSGPCLPLDPFGGARPLRQAQDTPRAADRRVTYHSEQGKKGGKPPEENLLLGMKPASLFIRIVPARKRMHP